MPIFIKAHRRGKSVVRAYTRANNLLHMVDNRLYGKKTMSTGRQRQLRMLGRKLENMRETATHVLNAKLSIGNALLSPSNVRASPRYFSSHLSKQFANKRR